MEKWEVYGGGELGLEEKVEGNDNSASYCNKVQKARNLIDIIKLAATFCSVKEHYFSVHLEEFGFIPFFDRLPSYPCNIMFKAMTR